MRRYTAVLAAVFALALVAGACSKNNNASTGTNTPPVTSSPSPSSTPTSFGDAATFFLKAGDQNSSDGKTIVIAQAVFTGENGFVAIHSDAGGAPGPVIGVTDLLTAGTHDNVTITLTTALTASATVFPMLHTDSDKDGKYTFPGPDGPAMVGGKVVVFPIKVTVG